MLIYDSHCHVEYIQSKEFDHRLVFNNENMIIIARLFSQLKDLFDIRTANNAYKISFGVHPWDVNIYDCNDIKNILQLNINKYRPNLIGEIGLDKCTDNFINQIDLYYKQLCIAIENNLPVIIHCVKSYNELINITKKVLRLYSIKKINGIVHSFNSNELIAHELIQLGFFLGIGNNIQLNSKIAKSIALIPINKLLIESDAPFFLDKKNTNIKINCFLNLQIISRIININLIDLINILNHNLNRFLNN